VPSFFWESNVGHASEQFGAIGAFFQDCNVNDAGLFQWAVTIRLCFTTNNQPNLRP